MGEILIDACAVNRAATAQIRRRLKNTIIDRAVDKKNGLINLHCNCVILLYISTYFWSKPLLKCLDIVPSVLEVWLMIRTMLS